MSMIHRHCDWEIMALFKKILIATAGGTLLAAGVAMLVLPGPAFVVIPAALAILAIEFVWAKRCLVWLRERVKAFAPARSPSARPPNANPGLRPRL
jgi:tellurite resistance protein TerC